mmetsp:Transcript_29152/g.113202  ORF Transcript_29152/g.113202 Transcript_29152/m.113202 type:complete len:235 (+) Transcript_29152:1528-2232(+)
MLRVPKERICFYVDNLVGKVAQVGRTSSQEHFFQVHLVQPFPKPQARVKDEDSRVQRVRKHVHANYSPGMPRMLHEDRWDEGLRFPHSCAVWAHSWSFDQAGNLALSASHPIVLRNPAHQLVNTKSPVLNRVREVTYVAPYVQRTKQRTNLHRSYPFRLIKEMLQLLLSFLVKSFLPCSLDSALQLRNRRNLMDAELFQVFCHLRVREETGEHHLQVFVPAVPSVSVATRTVEV